MSDFAQSGLISTLQQLNDGHLPALERDLEALSHQRPLALVLPCHGPDLAQPALAHILSELKEARFLSEILVSLNGIDAAGLQFARTLFAQLPQRVRILWTDGPQAAPLLEGLQAGKGLNVWCALGILCHDAHASVIAFQDCDVASFKRSTLARLFYPCAHPHMDYAFAKMYYSRATDRLYGRVSRLFFAPLLQAVTRLAGHQPLISFLQSFRYPLAGECAMTRATATQLPLSGGWGLETGLLCEMFRLEDPRRVCQVDGGTGYDHKHQPATGALQEMCSQIARVLLAHLVQEGVHIDPGFRAALPQAFAKEAALAIQRSANLALMNGFPFDQSAEQTIADTFAGQLQAPATTESDLALPSWSSMARTRPELAPQLAAIAQPAP